MCTPSGVYIKSREFGELTAATKYWYRTPCTMLQLAHFRLYWNSTTEGAAHGSGTVGSSQIPYTIGTRDSFCMPGQPRYHLVEGRYQGEDSRSRRRVGSRGQAAFHGQTVYSSDSTQICTTEGSEAGSRTSGQNKQKQCQPIILSHADACM